MRISIPETKVVVNNVCRQLQKSGWTDELRLFLISDEFELIIEKLKQLKKSGRHTTPTLETAFRWLYSTPVKKVKAVMLINSTSNILERADGIPLSCSTRVTPDYTTSRLFDSLKVNGRYESEKDTDLVRWSKQGVLMIPLALTSTVNGKPNIEIWSPFIAYLISKLNERNDELPWVLAGTKTHDYENMIISPYIIQCTINPMTIIQGIKMIDRVLEEEKKILGINW